MLAVLLIPFAIAPLCFGVAFYYFGLESGQEPWLTKASTMYNGVLAAIGGLLGLCFVELGELPVVGSMLVGLLLATLSLYICGLLAGWVGRRLIHHPVVLAQVKAHPQIASVARAWVLSRIVDAKFNPKVIA